MGGVASGSPVSAANTNSAFLEKNADDTTIGAITLANTEAASGSTINNVQQALNALTSYTGMPLNSVKTVKPAWSNNDVGTSSDDLKTRADSLTAKFNGSTGHAHSGAAGDGAPIQSANIASVPNQGMFLQGVNLTGVTGGSSNLTSQFTGQTPSSSATVQGIVVNAPFNKTILRNADTGAQIEDASGNEVYGRITYSGSTWTMTYYVSVSGTETAYSFATATDVEFFYQELFNPIVNMPTYSELAVTPSTSATADVVAASETVAGKVMLASSAPPPVASSSVKGSSTSVAKSDHTHEGVHSLFATGDSQITGDIQIDPGTGVTITRTGNKFTFASSTGAVGYQETPAGSVNGTNAVFGPLSQTPSSAGSILVFVDGLNIPSTQWSYATGYITFLSAPAVGQSVYVYYISGGTPVVPPPASGTIRVEYRTVSSGEAASQILTLAYTPADPSLVMVDIVGGSGAQYYNVDYTVVSNQFRWAGYALDGILSQGDQLRFYYQT